MEGPSRRWSEECERALLGGLLQAPDLLDDILSVVKPDAFFHKHHERLFEILVQMHESRRPIDITTLTSEISKAGSDGRDVGGLAYVFALQREAPTTANLLEYALIVHSHALARGVSSVLNKGLKDVEADGESPRQIIDRVVDNLSDLVAFTGQQDWVTVAEISSAAYQDVVSRSEQAEPVVGTPTGFADLDETLSGFQAQSLVIIAARPGMGKTAFALSLANNAAKKGYGVGVISLEMGRQELVMRLLSSLAQIDGAALRTGQLPSQDSWNKLDEAVGLLQTLPIYIDDTPGMKLSDVRGRARRLAAKDASLGMIIIDYLQLMQGDDPRAARYAQVTDISRGLKILAKELNIPILALSQLNRDLEKRKDKRPMLSDLRESGAIEQDADVILMLYRDEKYNPDSEDLGLAEIIIAKNRSGKTMTSKVAFLDQFATFVDCAADLDDL